MNGLLYLTVVRMPSFKEFADISYFQIDRKKKVCYLIPLTCFASSVYPFSDENGHT